MTRSLTSLTAVLLVACAGSPEPTPEPTDPTGPPDCLDYELCDGIDNDCDGEIDEGTQATFFADLDEDGYGDADAAVVACEAPEGHVPTDGDCDDGLAAIFPGAPEVCDGRDNDCDGGVDEAFLVFTDADGDGFGDPASATVDCEPEPDLVAIGGDCDDSRRDVSPDGVEICDGIDNDCDPQTSEAGLATFLAEDGRVDVDVSSTLAGTMAEPALVVLDEPGTLAICEGTWYTRFDVQAKGVHLDGVSGSGATILDAAGTGRIVSVRTSNSSFSIAGFTLQNGDATNETSCIEGVGGALCVRNTASHFFYDDLVLVGNRARSGGGMFAAIGTHTLTDVVFRDNHADDDGGGLATDRAQMILQSTDLVDNSSGRRGGGMSVQNGFLELDDVEVAGNLAVDGGGIAARSRVTALDTRILDNEASAQGGGLHLVGGASTVLEDTVVHGNRAPVGGAVRIALGSEATMTCRGAAGLVAGIFDNETTASDGAAVDIGGGTFVAEDCDFVDAGLRNTPHDLRLDSDGFTHDVAAPEDATLACSDAGCPTEL